MDFSARAVALFVVIAMFAGTAGCTKPGRKAGSAPPPRPKSLYYDTRALLQAAQKNSATDALLKRTVTDDAPEQEALVQHPDWAKELAIFNLADLAKPAWAGMFRVDTAPSAAGVKVRYTATSTKPEVRQLTLLLSTKGVPLAISTQVAASNYLFSSESFAYISFAYPYGATKPMIDSLAVDGNQKIIFADPFNYHLDGRAVR